MELQKQQQQQQQQAQQQQQQQQVHQLSLLEGGDSGGVGNQLSQFIQLAQLQQVDPQQFDQLKVGNTCTLLGTHAIYTKNSVLEDRIVLCLKMKKIYTKH